MTLNVAINLSAGPTGAAQGPAAASQQPETDSPLLEAAVQQLFKLLKQLMSQIEADSASAGDDAGAGAESSGEGAGACGQQPAAAPPRAQGAPEPAAPAPAAPAPDPAQAHAATPAGFSGVPGAPIASPQRTDKPTDPTQSVDSYLNANNGVLKKLGNQEGVQDKLKQRYGDWTDTNRSQQDREQSAYNASRHVGIIKNKAAADGTPRSPALKNSGKMDGATHDRDIRDGTEMADLKNSLANAPSATDTDPGRWTAQDKASDDVLRNPNLKKTKDTHVRADGTNKDNFQWAAGEAGKALWFVPLVSHVLHNVGESRNGVAGVVKGVATGVVQMYKDDLVGLVNSVKKGRINPLLAAAEMFKANIADTPDAPQVAKDIANL